MSADDNLSGSASMDTSDASSMKSGLSASRAFLLSGLVAVVVIALVSGIGLTATTDGSRSGVTAGSNPELRNELRVSSNGVSWIVAPWSWYQYVNPNASDDDPTSVWCTGYGATRKITPNTQALGKGLSNTNTMLGNCTGGAAQLVQSLNVALGVASDNPNRWYLCSDNELYRGVIRPEAYNQLPFVPFVANPQNVRRYWSSSDTFSFPKQANYWNTQGSGSYASKSNSYYVRPCRNP
jgi:hypothetical protein